MPYSSYIDVDVSYLFGCLMVFANVPTSIVIKNMFEMEEILSLNFIGPKEFRENEMQLLPHLTRYGRVFRSASKHFDAADLCDCFTIIRRCK